MIRKKKKKEDINDFYLYTKITSSRYQNQQDKNIV